MTRRMRMRTLALALALGGCSPAMEDSDSDHYPVLVRSPLLGPISCEFFARGKYPLNDGECAISHPTGVFETRLRSGRVRLSDYAIVEASR